MLRAVRCVLLSGGVLGLNFLRMFEVEICQDRKRMAFHPPGHIDKGVLDVAGMAVLHCDVLKGRHGGGGAGS